MPPIRLLAEGKAALSISEELKVNSRVLVTPHTSISIPNVATISVVPIIPPVPNAGPWLIVILLVTAVILYVMPSAAYGGVGPHVLVLALCAASLIGLAVWRFRPRDPHWRLLIGCSDGSLTYFTAPQRETLDKVRQLLTDKIDKGGVSPAYNINFVSGDINVVEQGASVGAIVQSSSDQVATANGRIGSPDVGSPHGVQIGNGHHAAGDTHTGIDYSAVLPQILKLKAHYQRDPQYAYIIERLNQLEQLMRMGTPDEQSKGRMRELLSDLAHIFNAIPAAMGVFRQVGRLAGLPV
jgi:hypothetical protein